MVREVIQVAITHSRREQAELCGTLKRILIQFCGDIHRGDKSVSRTAVASGKNKVRAIYS